MSVSYAIFKRGGKTPFEAAVPAAEKVIKQLNKVVDLAIATHDQRLLEAMAVLTLDLTMTNHLMVMFAGQLTRAETGDGIQLEEQ